MFLSCPTGVVVVSQKPFDEFSPPTWSAAVDESDEYSNDDGEVRPFQVGEAQSQHSMRQRRSIRKQAIVGGSAILECDIPYPPGVGGFASLASSASVSGPNSNDNSVMIKWHKQGIEVPIFIQLNRLPAHVDANYHGRIRLLDHASGSVEITGVRPKDEGWYECSVVFLQRTDETNPNGTWVYLAVTGEKLHVNADIIMFEFTCTTYQRRGGVYRWLLTSASHDVMV